MCLFQIDFYTWNDYKKNAVVDKKRKKEKLPKCASIWLGGKAKLEVWLFFLYGWTNTYNYEKEKRGGKLLV